MLPSSATDSAHLGAPPTLSPKVWKTFRVCILHIERLQPLLQRALAHECRVEAAAGHPVGVRLGFGVHAGWAMEGVAGSALKMDWTLVSPSVNLAARLETATKQVHVLV